eukprot:2297457-Prymnesium_polylepis.1
MATTELRLRRLDELSEDDLTVVLSVCTARTVCTVNCVSSVLRASASSAAVWDALLERDWDLTRATLIDKDFMGCPAAMPPLSIYKQFAARTPPYDLPVRRLLCQPHAILPLSAARISLLAGRLVAPARTAPPPARHHSAPPLPWQLESDEASATMQQHLEVSWHANTTAGFSHDDSAFAPHRIARATLQIAHLTKLSKR